MTTLISPCPKTPAAKNQAKEIQNFPILCQQSIPAPQNILYPYRYLCQLTKSIQRFELQNLRTHGWHMLEMITAHWQ